MKLPCRYCGGSPKTLADVPRMTWWAACSNCACSTAPLLQQASDTAKDMEEKVNKLWNSRNLGGLQGPGQSASVKEQLTYLLLPHGVTAELVDYDNAVGLDVHRSSMIVLRPPGQGTEGWVAEQFFSGGATPRAYPCREGVRSLQAAVDDALSALSPQVAPSAGAIEPRRTWRGRLFPQPPQFPLQDGATVTQVHVRLDWKDRLRLLLGGQPRVTVVQEFDPKRAGHLVSRSIFWVEAPRW